MNVDIYTDGSCSKSGRGGFAAIMFIDGVQIDAVYGGEPDTTNNRMELRGIIEGLQLIPVLKHIACANCGVTEFMPTDDPAFSPEPYIAMKDLAECELGQEPCSKIKKWLVPVPMYQGVTIYSDSEYCLKGAAHWLEMWKTNGWRTKAKQPVKNQEEWQIIDALKKLHQPNWQWIKGHAGNAGNELADSLATTACSLTTHSSWQKKL
jgi:ribonuclease HI